MLPERAVFVEDVNCDSKSDSDTEENICPSAAKRSRLEDSDAASSESSSSIPAPRTSSESIPSDNQGNSYASKAPKPPKYSIANGPTCQSVFAI